MPGLIVRGDLFEGGESYGFTSNSRISVGSVAAQAGINSLAGFNIQVNGSPATEGTMLEPRTSKYTVTLTPVNHQKAC